ncbi:hypothetical protein CYMTET_18933 [Cymbomonas tetramitiformis]|uniref:PsbP C-terminal domain-containing protein n=1 Tax=Cymbomonas tetramitiformis TaxID=36881 RepID=A0AAE0G744_9CHLO|nr:hypothetical protein CYMTET_18933 [Cymbomonas tetramitiformis]
MYCATIKITTCRPGALSQRSRSSTARSHLTSKPDKICSTGSRIVCKTRCAAGSENEESSRRGLLLSGSSLVALQAFSFTPKAFADDDFGLFYGAANPPATPNKVGGTTKQFARYSFLYPTAWTEEVITKVEKGTNGTDCRFVSSSRKKEKVFLLTLSNEGGSKRFNMEQDPITLLTSLTGSLVTFQDALAEAEVSVKTVDKDGKQFFEYRLEGADSYLVSITVEDGRVFGLFVNAPARGFNADGEMLQKVVESFQTYPNA